MLHINLFTNWFLSLPSRGVEDVDDLMADIHEQMELADEISTAISQPTGFGQDIDEVSLMVDSVWHETIFMCGKISFSPLGV